MEQIKKYAPFGAVVCAILVIVMGFLPGAVCCIPHYASEVESASLFKMAFGGSVNRFGDVIQAFGFSFFNFIAFVFVVAGAVVAFLTMSGKLPKFASLVAAGLLVVAGALFLFALSSSQAGQFFHDYSASAWELKEVWGEFIVMYELGFGAIVAAIVSFLGAGCAAAPFVLDVMGK